MRYDFYTICDRGYAARALVLYGSLEEVCSDFRLRVFCIDEATRRFFDELSLPRVVVVDMRELEASDPELLQTRSTRTNAEYCWTAKASACLYTFRLEPDVDMLTYLDSDLMFFHDPEPLFDELGTESILIVPHRNPARLQWWDNWGIYNAGFVTFRRDETGMSALRWWRERCLEWCFARLEDGKSGDQTYLDDWPTRFPGTHVLEHVGGGLGPWNITESSLDGHAGTVRVDGSPLVFFHFATLRLYGDRPWLRRVGLLPRAYHFTPGPIRFIWTIDRSYAAIRRNARELVWDAYVSRVSDALAEFRRTEPGVENELAQLSLGDVFARSAPSVVLRWAARLRRAFK